MGGCTIVKVASDLKSLFLKIERQLLGAANAGLYVDSELIVIDPDEPEARIFKATAKLSDAPFDSVLKGVEFEEVEEGRYFHVGMATMFTSKPEKGQLLGTIHVHT